MKKTIGTHIVGDLRMCDSGYLSRLDMEAVKREVYEIIKKHNLTVLGSYFHLFKNNSFTGVVALSESHVSIHTWPEFGVVNMDVYACNYNHDNTQATRCIFDEIARIFRSKKINRREIKR